jgi:hypothetical protein
LSILLLPAHLLPRARNQAQTASTLAASTLDLGKLLPADQTYITYA